MSMSRIHGVCSYSGCGVLLLYYKGALIRMRVRSAFADLLQTTTPTPQTEQIRDPKELAVPELKHIPCHESARVARPRSM